MVFMIWEDVVSVLTVSIILLLSGCSSSSNSEIPKQIKKLENLTVISPEEKPSHSIDFEREVEFGQTGDVIYRPKKYYTFRALRAASLYDAKSTDFITSKDIKFHPYRMAMLDRKLILEG